VSMRFDQKELLRISLNGSIEPRSDFGKGLDLLGRDLPRARVKGHGVKVDARHSIPDRNVITNFIERVGTLDEVDRRCAQGFVDERRIGPPPLYNIALARYPNHGRRQVYKEVERTVMASPTVTCGMMRAVINNDDLTAIR